MTKNVLTPRELLAISQDIRLKHRITPPVHKPQRSESLTRQDLKALSDQISLYYAPRGKMDKDKLLLLPVDPARVYVFWNLSQQTQNRLAQKVDSSQLVLQIYASDRQSLTNQETGSKLRLAAQRPLNQTSPISTIPVIPQMAACQLQAEISYAESKTQWQPCLKSNQTFGYSCHTANAPYYQAISNDHSADLTPLTPNASSSAVLFRHPNPSGIGQTSF